MKANGAVLITTLVAALAVAPAFASPRGRAQSTAVRTTIDRTLSCPVPAAAGVHPMYVNAQANQKPKTIPGDSGLQPNPATLYVGVSRTPLLAFNSGTSDRTLAEDTCASAKQIPFSSKGLPLLGTFRVNDDRSVNRACWIGARVILRIRATLDGSGYPVAVQLKLLTPRQRALAYIEWRPTRVRAYASRSFCHEA